MAFDSSGNLILPAGAAQEFAAYRRTSSHTGVYLECPRCHHIWERKSRKAGILRCYLCNKGFRVEALP